MLALFLTHAGAVSRLIHASDDVTTPSLPFCFQLKNCIDEDKQLPADRQLMPSVFECVHHGTLNREAGRVVRLARLMWDRTKSEAAS